MFYEKAISILSRNEKRARHKPRLKYIIDMTNRLRSENIIFSGYAVKLGGKVRNWKRRYFVLTIHRLCYYDYKVFHFRVFINQ